MTAFPVQGLQPGPHCGRFSAQQKRPGDVAGLDVGVQSVRRKSVY